MTVLDVLSTIRQAGGSVVVVDGNLKIRVPTGLLTPEHRAVLVEYKATLVRLLAPDVDPEREAIQWVEGLSAPEAEVVVETAIQEWEDLVRGDQLGEYATWIPRTSADGREGFDRPGTPVEDRWWEHTAFEDLPQ